ncbi:hypothetical protein [Photobacterium damselae]|nr:hypothetical protein [Photobacterium damselae]UKA05024.1 hypothetical protein IHC89_22520 [Photobacterium damselae subsp. damselae]
MTELLCYECNCVIGMHKPSGAPYNHIYYCTSCAEDILRQEEDDED